MTLPPSLLPAHLVGPAGPTGAFVLPGDLAGWAAVLAGYLLGSVPFGLLLGWLKGVDIRRQGSGNIGATNVGRALGRPWALVAFLCDAGKGAVPAALFAPLAAPPGPAATSLAVLAGAAAVLGHCFPLYLRFRGGKGVATGCGALIAIDPLVFVLGGLVWLATLALTRWVGLASLAMGAAFPLVAWLRRGPGGYGTEVVWGALALFLLILVRHRANIVRMWNGTEPRIGGGKADAPAASRSTESRPAATEERPR